MARKQITKKEKQRRKRFAMAIFLTCIAAAMIGGSLHVIDLGAMRMDEMRGKASYDIAEVHDHIRAAGEDISIQAEHEADGPRLGYSKDELASLLNAETWQELDSMVAIPAGIFEMGTNRTRSNKEDGPAHQVNVPTFWIDKYPVTQAQYAKFVLAEKYRVPLNWVDGLIPSGLLEHPVTLISWYNARDYCAWAGKRLPQEAEWEKAARGTDARRWPWGNKMDVSRLNTYYKVGATTAVRDYPNGASAYGVMDMAGNVSEWMFDLLSPYSNERDKTYDFSPELDQFTNQGSENVERISNRVMRGGSWKSDPFSTESYHRNYSLPNMASDFYGFRCVTSTAPVENNE